MLVLTGKSKDEVYLQLPGGERVVVTVVQIRGKVVRIGFTAPKAITIVRRDAVNKLPRVRDTNQISSAEATR